MQATEAVEPNDKSGQDMLIINSLNLYAPPCLLLLLPPKPDLLFTPELNPN
jgi:hypothetical protein